MSANEILKILEEVDAIQYGHFILSSGKRSSTYCQCAKIFINPKIGELICKKLANLVSNQIKEKIDYVVAPALGGVLVGYEMAKQLSAESIFYERVDEKFIMRRGFKLEEGKNILFVEDVITTGKSTNECLLELNKLNINLIGIASIVDRTSKKVFEKYEIISLLKLNIPVYDPENLPEELKKLLPIKPGSRKI